MYVFLKTRTWKALSQTCTVLAWIIRYFLMKGLEPQLKWALSGGRSWVAEECRCSSAHLVRSSSLAADPFALPATYPVFLHIPWSWLLIFSVSTSLLQYQKPKRSSGSHTEVHGTPDGLSGWQRSGHVPTCTRDSPNTTALEECAKWEFAKESGAL